MAKKTLKKQVNKKTLKSNVLASDISKDDISVGDISKKAISKKNIKKDKILVEGESNPIEKIGEELTEIINKKSFRYGLLIIGISIFLAIIILLSLGIKLHFLINNELSLTINPKSHSLYTINNEVSVINYTLENDNFFQCNTFCEFKVIDLNNSELLYNYSKILAHGEFTSEVFEISSPKKGEGQKIYNLKISCNNIKSFICSTNEDKKYKTSLITLNYELSEDEKLIKYRLLNDINYLKKVYSNASVKLNETTINVNLLPSFEKKGKLVFLENTTNKLKSAEKEILLYESIFKDEDYLLLNKGFNESLVLDLLYLNNELNNISNESINTIELHNVNYEIFVGLNELKIDLLKPVSFYSKYKNNVNANELDKISATSDKITETYLLIDYLSEVEINKRMNKSIFELDSYLLRFNSLVNESNNLINEGQNLLLINETINEEDFCEIFNELLITNLTNYTNYESLIINFTDLNCKDDLDYSYDLSDFFDSNYSLKKINLPVFNISESYDDLLEDNLPVCCFKEKCNACYTSYNDNKSYPILFIHGHIFNDANSPEYSLESFVKIQQELEKIGYINAGELDLTEDYKDWVRNGNPMSVLGSYYYISFYNLGAYSITAQKSERIENYALRLKEIVDAYKMRTGAEKIIIVSHSMGGLVSREYINLFGGSSVDKLILINTPNHGITTKISKLCTILGSAKECEDMTEGSVFLNRLNDEYNFKNTYSIRSVGCLMDNVTGDGIVTNQSGYLENAVNYVIEGKCTDNLNNNLHTDILNPALYRETVEIVEGILEG